jgi:diguanylate cyclase (GGDEF)-like protein
MLRDIGVARWAAPPVRAGLKMRSLSQRISVPLVCASVLVALTFALLGILGTLGDRSATNAGNDITEDELTTALTTAQVGHSMDLAYATGEEVLLAPAGRLRAGLVVALSTTLVPRVGLELANLERLHATDPPAEWDGILTFAHQWGVVSNLLALAGTSAGPQPGLARRLAADYGAVSTHISHLLTTEHEDARASEAQASANGATTVRVISGTTLAGVILAAALAWSGSRRVRRIVEPAQDQVEFGDNLQIAANEHEAYELLQRHLERTFDRASVVVLNRNNSADRLEAATSLPAGSPLAVTLRGAAPETCLALRSGRSHQEDADHPGLLACAVCSSGPGSSTCSPVMVGGQVIGSVLLNRATPCSEQDSRRIRDSVGQAAPVIANLRNLAVAEIRAATDGLTGLPNKRAVTDTAKRMFAQATRSGAPLTVVLLDLDHFKDVNDRYGHPVGDQVLANVGAVLKETLRAGDFAGRNGGEEFALLLPETDLAGGYEIAERLRHALGELAHIGVEVPVTASLGLATYPDHAQSLERLERLADAALYVAKRSGRDRVEVADPSTDAGTLPVKAVETHRGMGAVRL